MQKYILIWRKRQTGRKWIKYCVRFLLLGLILLLGTILLCNGLSFIVLKVVCMIR